jgi:cardiolipin synthase (CMP-forming)
MGRYKYIIPSIFSFLRLFLSVYFPFSSERFWLLWIIAAALSDFLDGWLARRWQVESWQGGLLDAIADKLFIIVALVVFVSAGKFSLWWIYPVIIRDLVVGFTVCYTIFHRNWKAFQDMDARVSGKLTTCGQFVLFIVVLLLPEKMVYALILASCFSIVAAVDYGWLFFKALKRQCTNE